MKTTEEKALKAIIKAEQSRRTFKNINEIFGKQNKPLTQVDVLSDPNNKDSLQNTITSREELERQILKRNRKHSLQPLDTPFFTKPTLRTAIDPYHNNSHLDSILNGSFSSTNDQLTEHERVWIQELQQKVGSKISLTLTCDDYKRFFRAKQERTASSPSGCHFGHYRVLLECLRKQDPTIPELIINIAYIALVTASLLDRWHTASQVMLEKGKGTFIDHLCIIQLVEADLNFILHVIWGKLLIRHAKQHSALDSSQYALPDETCNNSVLS